MPNVTIERGCSSIIWAATWTARPNSRAGSMTWSAGVTRSVASGSWRGTRAARRPTHRAARHAPRPHARGGVTAARLADDVVGGQGGQLAERLVLVGVAGDDPAALRRQGAGF